MQALSAVAIRGRLLDRVRGDSELGTGESKVGISTIYDGDASNARGNESGIAAAPALAPAAVMGLHHLRRLYGKKLREKHSSD